MSEDTEEAPKKKRRKSKRRRKTPGLGDRVINVITHPAVLTAVVQCVKELKVTSTRRR